MGSDPINLKTGRAERGPACFSVMSCGVDSSAAGPEIFSVFWGRRVSAADIRAAFLGDDFGSNLVCETHGVVF